MHDHQAYGSDTTWLASYPRSGNTLLRMILFHTFGQKTASVYGQEFVGETNDVVGFDPESTYVKTHRQADCVPAFNAIYVVRDRATCLQSRLDFTGCELITPEWGEWEEHVTGWMNRPNTLVLRYEELLTDETYKRIEEFTGLKPSEGRVPEFSELNKIFPEFFNKGYGR